MPQKTAMLFDAREVGIVPRLQADFALTLEMNMGLDGLAKMRA